MDKKVYFYIDDVIWLFRDLARQRPKSIYDNSFMKMLKEAHDKYGLKVLREGIVVVKSISGNIYYTKDSKILKLIEG